MSNSFFRILLFSFALFVSPVYSQGEVAKDKQDSLGVVLAPDQAKMKDALETCYNTWRQSMLRSSYEGWASQTSASRQMKVRNLAVSERRKFPESLFKHQMEPPALMNLRYVGTLLGAQGRTAAATYFGKVDFAVGKVATENAIVLLFVNENGVWKYDQARFFNLAKLPVVREKLSKGDRSILLEQDGFQPLLGIPMVPPACPAPKYIAKVFVDCPGRIVDVVVNNISAHQFENTKQAEVISGGLRDGANSISYRTRLIEPVKEGEKSPPMAIGVFIMPETQGNVPGKAYHFGVVWGEPLTNKVDVFNVTAEMIREMNPKYKPAKKNHTPTNPIKK